MIGLEYYRRKRQMTRGVLAARAGVTVDTIRTYVDRGITDYVPVEKLLALADALEISLDELVAEHDDTELTSEDRPVRSSKIVSPQNVINNYRIRHNLRFAELAVILGLGDRESARTACRRETAREVHILRLCQYEHLDPDLFIMQYGKI